MVYVLNKSGTPLMPTRRYGKVRRLIKTGLAIVIQHQPFTIKLLYDTLNKVQFVNLGVDAGSKHVGFSASTTQTVLFEAQLDLRTDITKKIATRKQYRIGRRYHKTRYREARFNNRIKSKRHNWVAPSIKNKIDSHIYWITRICSFLPIKKIIIEVGQFDTQLLKANDNNELAPRGRDYQTGVQLAFWNTREYILYRDNHTCQCCKGKSGDSILNIHHIESRKIGGNRPDNLITLCKTCHRNYHAGILKLPSRIKRPKSYRDAATMNMFRNHMYKQLKQMLEPIIQVNVTYGYITKHCRIKYNLPKTHIIDARCISEHPLAKPSSTYWRIKKRRNHNRQLHKSTILKGGLRKNNQAPYEVFGFRLFDAVKYHQMTCFVTGRRLTGLFAINNIDKTIRDNSISYKKLSHMYHTNSNLMEEMMYHSSNTN